MNNCVDISERLQKIKNFYLKLDEMMDKLPDSIPADTRKMIGFAFRASWSIIKVMFTLVFLPLILVGLVFKGLVTIALPVLLVVGLFSLLDRA